MPTTDAIKFLYKDFTNKTKKITHNVYQHPDAIQTLLKTLAENRSLTVLQYDHMVKYLTQRREVQRKVELGEEFVVEPDFVMEHTGHVFPRRKELEAAAAAAKAVAAAEAAAAAAANPQTDLQKKILEILNKKPLMQQLAKKAEIQAKPLNQAEKEELKTKLLNDDKIKLAMQALRNTKRN